MAVRVPLLVRFLIGIRALQQHAQLLRRHPVPAPASDNHVAVYAEITTQE